MLFSDTLSWKEILLWSTSQRFVLLCHKEQMSSDNIWSGMPRMAKLPGKDARCSFLSHVTMDFLMGSLIVVSYGLISEYLWELSIVTSMLSRSECWTVHCDLLIRSTKWIYLFCASLDMQGEFWRTLPCKNLSRLPIERGAQRSKMKYYYMIHWGWQGFMVHIKNKKNMTATKHKKLISDDWLQF